EKENAAEGSKEGFTFRDGLGGEEALLTLFAEDHRCGLHAPVCIALHFLDKAKERALWVRCSRTMSEPDGALDITGSQVGHHGVQDRGRSDRSQDTSKIEQAIDGPLE